MNALSDYAAPRARVSTLLKSGEIIRVKKGLYVFGTQTRRGSICRELLANLVCGPSIVSLDSALAYYQMIPERADAMTSVTTVQPRRFETPLGLFLYRPTPSLSSGIDRVVLGEKSFLIATPERALADKLRDDRSGKLRTRNDAEIYLFENLRINQDAVRNLDADQLETLASELRSNKIRVCAAFIRSMRRHP
jgi:hypothetical protein